MASQKILVHKGVVAKFQFIQNSDQIPLEANDSWTPWYSMQLT